MEEQTLSNLARALAGALGVSVSVYDGEACVLSAPEGTAVGAPPAIDGGQDVVHTIDERGERFIAVRRGEATVVLGPFLVERLGGLSPLPVFSEEQSRHIGELMRLILGADTEHAPETLRQEKPRTQARRFSTPISETMQYINTHLTDRLTLPQLAQRVHLHPNYLSSVFKRETGESVTNYILRSRIREAAHMLQNTQLSASEIARIFGFCNQSYFIKTFRRYMYCSPQQYREGAASAEA